MKYLINKYLKGNLTKLELDKLRTHNKNEVDQVLEEVMQEIWQHGEFDSSVEYDKSMEKVKYEIDKKLSVKRIRLPFYIKALGWAAAVLLPLFILSTIYLYQQQNSGTSDEMTVFTEKGERATVTLPDGTKVQLNSESKLSYSSVKFNKKERLILFSGEGFFNVSKDNARPFIINSHGLNVKVLGTVFNLKAKPNASSAELALVSGSVMFKSLLTGKSVVLKPNQKLLLNQLTGSISITNQYSNDIGTWSKNELVFRNAPLSVIIQSIERAYNIKIEIKSKINTSELFTGTLSSNDLNGVLEVLERSFRFNIVLHDGKASITDIK